MNEESDGMNENENNNSEVVMLPERSHVEELMISDQSRLKEQNAYERKLDEKLRDLGLYEDNMTVNQKEELLAVVVISCETADQEENKRQLVREYLEGAQSLEAEIEFSYQESAWLSSEDNFLCSSSVIQAKNDSTSCNRKVHADISEDQQSSTSESRPKNSMFHKTRSRGGKRGGRSSDTNVKIAVAHPIVQEDDSDKTETTEIIDRQLSFQRQKLLLDKSMGCWKPCGSPKDKPLSNFRLKWKEDKNVSASSTQVKFKKYLASFEKISSSLKSKRSFIQKVMQLNKPYVLMHHGSVAKKATKLDNYDYIVGVSEKSQNNEENEDHFMPSNTLTRAESAFDRVKPLNLHSDSSSKITLSGTAYGSKRFKSEQEKLEASPPEIVLDDSCTQAFSASKDSNTFATEKHVTFHEGVIDDSNNKLPKFSDLRPDISKCKMVVPNPLVQKDNSINNTAVKANCDSHASSSVKKTNKEEAMGSQSEKDYSSDSLSSLIDVETVVDEEGEEK